MSNDHEENTCNICRLHVTLDGSEPPIWRRFSVRANINLWELHQVLQVVMGWKNCHALHFITGTKIYGEPAPEVDPSILDVRKTALTQIAPEVGGQFLYKYDFGLDWRHTVKVEEVTEAPGDACDPICLAGERACPPEGCGGMEIYRKFLAAIKDPKHPHHMEMTAWIGRPFDPEKFDLGSVNARLRKHFSKQS